MTSSHAKPRRLPLWGRILLGVLGAVTAAAVALGAVYGVLYAMGRHSLTGRGSTLSAPESLIDDADDGLHRVTYQGVTYRFNPNVVSVLIMGLDKDDIGTADGYGQNGQADCLFVAAIDTASGATRIIPLSRESMVEVNVYGKGGGYAGVEKTQLCLAYAYGATGEESCENVVRSVRRLLYGVDINAYAAIDLEGLAALTDKAGGLTVTAPDTVNSPKLYVAKGQTVTLNGDKATTYIQYRDNDVNANNRRIQRQKQFLGAFIKKVKGQLAEDPTRLTGYWDTAAPYLVTDLTLSRLTYLVSCGLTAADPEYLSITGETVMGEKYVEFYPDTTSLYEAVLTAFYTPEESEEAPTP